MWNWSLAVCFTMYLLQQMRPASRASADSCSYSSETRWTHRGNSSTPAFLRPRSKIRILGSGTPSGQKEGTRQHQPSYVRDRRYGSWDQEHPC